MKLRTKLYPHQEKALTFALSHPYHICGLEMGLGKSLVALALAVETKARTLVICPAYLRKNWENEVSKHTEGLDVTIISYGSITKLESIDFDLVIADEFHFCKTPKAKRSEAVHDLLQNGKPKYFIGLTGSVIKNRVSEFWSLLQACYHGGHYDEFKPFYRLYYKFCNTFSNERTFDTGKFVVVRFDGIKNVERLKQLIAPVYIRMKTRDVIDLPKTNDIYITSKQSKKYEADLKEAFKLFKQDPNDAEYMSMKRANAFAKIKATISLAKDMLDQDEKVVIFSDHVDSTKAIAKALKCPYVVGSVNADKRGEIVDEFENGKHQAIAATIGSLSTGVNLTSASKMIFNDTPFVGADIDQAKARIWRIGQDKPCFYYYIVSSDFDKKLSDMIQRKSKDIRKIYD